MSNVTTASGARFKDEWLVRCAVSRLGISSESIEKLRAQERPFLADALIAAHLADEKAIELAVSGNYGLACVVPTRGSIDKLALTLVPESLCRSRMLVPTRINGDCVELAMANPLDADALADVQGISGRTPIPFYCFPAKLAALMNELYDPEKAAYDLLNSIPDTGSIEVIGEADAAPESAEIRAPVIRLVNFLVATAVGQKASDIHIEHGERESVVRYRVDGLLKDAMTLPRSIAMGPLVARIKIMANLDIANRLRPQDGRSKLLVEGREVSLRVSTMPTQHGEKVVIRILDGRTALLPLAQLGFRPEIENRLNEVLRVPQGMLLVTGPTGSGKTTTLYAALNMLRSRTANLVTIEDPIEYQLEGVNQVQINEKQGLNFADVLRSVLRQDPDVIMVGEIRDPETAAVAFQAALTGHFVLSTLHTNDSLATISRLVDLGVERYKVGPGLTAIAAQRLVRRLCPDCRKPAPADETGTRLFAAQIQAGLPPRHFRAVGCANCAQTGYKGRIPLLELLTLTDGVRSALTRGIEGDALKKVALEERALLELSADALWRISEGETSLEEAECYLRLPLAEKGAKTVVPVKAPAATAGPRVLVADDDATTRTILRRSLEAQGYRVDEAADGTEALDRLQAETFNIVLLDLHMPRLDGREVLRFIRRDPRLSEMPVLVMTSDSDEESQNEVFELGADDYAVKPVKPAIAISRIKAALRRHSMGTSPAVAA